MDENEKRAIYLEYLKELNEKIDKEIVEYKDDVLFLPSEYRKHRLRGLEPNQIDYDMCHICR